MLCLITRYLVNREFPTLRRKLEIPTRPIISCNKIPLLALIKSIKFEPWLNSISSSLEIPFIGWSSLIGSTVVTRRTERPTWLYSHQATERPTNVLQSINI